MSIAYIRVQTNEGWLELKEERTSCWILQDIQVVLKGQSDELEVEVSAQTTAVNRLQIGWANCLPNQANLMGDAFERAYGDLAFAKLDSEKIFHWYFCASTAEASHCYGVKTRPNALCAWTVCAESIDLWLDIRNGSEPLVLAGRTLEACTIVISDDQKASYEAVSDFCQKMIHQNVSYNETIIGYNDWYQAYGNNSEQLILESTDFIQSIWPATEKVKPWVVVDDGWQAAHSSQYNGGPWSDSNDKFTNMAALAEKIHARGARTGIWFRPLLTKEAMPEAQILHHQANQEVILDISHPAVLEKVAKDVKRISEWGYELIKHDFTTYDIFGCWGREMDLNYQQQAIHFYDKTKTTAEIINHFYDVIKAAAGSTLIMGCNTISHLSAGIFEIMRTGDDTSGKDFNRTRKMGVNTLAFRMPQHQIFYLCDADCIGITEEISWRDNKKWLDCLSTSGTPLFISCDPSKLDTQQINDLKLAIENALKIGQSAIPLNWEADRLPQIWSTDLGNQKFEWFELPRAFFNYI